LGKGRGAGDRVSTWHIRHHCHRSHDRDPARGREKAKGWVESAKTELASKAIIDACRPFAWIDKFPPASALSHEDANAIAEKWRDALRGT
jgi:hypothetical protein